MVPAARSRPGPLLWAAGIVGWALAWVQPGPARGADEEVTWYAPTKEDFRPEYDRDRANQKVQTWAQYWGWVESFYKGNLLSEGWTQKGQECVAVVKSEPERRKFIKDLNELGVRIAKEWAKDNALRKISTADLNRWGAALREAGRKDDGTGKSLRSTLQKVQAEVDRKLSAGRRPRARRLALNARSGSSPRWQSGR
jgi:hypothetical protein